MKYYVTSSNNKIFQVSTKELLKITAVGFCYGLGIVFLSKYFFQSGSLVSNFKVAAILLTAVMIFVLSVLKVDKILPIALPILILFWACAEFITKIDSKWLWLVSALLASLVALTFGWIVQLKDNKIMAVGTILTTVVISFMIAL